METNNAIVRLIDKPDENGHADKIEIQAVIEGETYLHTVKYYPSPVTGSFRDDLDWYYREYLYQPAQQNQERAARIVQTIIRLGKQIGEQLLADDYVLYVILEKLEECKLENVAVVFESERPEFFEEPWEILVLPDSNRYLATSCAAFMRNHPQEPQPEQWLGLNAETPLHVLFVAPQPESDMEIREQIGFLNYYYTLLQHENAYQIEVLNAPTWQQLENHLARAKNGFHILHFEGYGTRQKTGEAVADHLLFEDESGHEDLRSLNDFSKLLVSNGIETVFLDLYQAKSNESDPVRESQLASAALNLIKDGIKAVVATHPTTYSFSGARFFHSIYTEIAAGKTLGRAVVETRKSMQLNCGQNSLTAQTIELHDWPIAVHYGTQDLGFFSEEDVAFPPAESKTIGDIGKNVVGFNGELLPPGEFFGRDLEIRQIQQAFTNQKTTVLCGHPGIGKTHLAHRFAYWFIASKSGKTAFYFDYRKGAFSKQTILQMIGHYFDGEKAVVSEIEHKLLHEKYLLVLDSFSCLTDNDEIKETLSTAEKEELIKFIREINNGESRLLILDTEQGTGASLVDTQVIKVKGLSPYEKKQLASGILRQSQQETKEADPGYEGLLDGLAGHPYLMQRILPLLEEQSAQTLGDALNAIKPPVAADPMLALFEYGWSTIPENWKPVLTVFADLRPFVSDAFSIAAEMKDEKHRSPGLELCSDLGVPKVAKMSEILEAGAKAGFFISKPSYKEIHPLAPAYLSQKRDAYRWPQAKLDWMKLTLSKILCLELKVLDPYLAQQSNPMLYHLVLENNQRWFDCLELIWQHRHYEMFLEGKTYLSSILARAGLKTLFDAWSYRLIKETPLTTSEPAVEQGLALAWLRMASDALAVEDALQSQAILAGVGYWDNWLQSTDNQDMAVFKSVLMFLETFYRKNNDWAARKHLSSLALADAEQRADHQAIIMSLQSLARCEEALGAVDRCRILEGKLLNDIPYDNLEKEIKAKVMIDITQSRINREEFAEAQTLLDHIKKMSDNKELSIVTKILQGNMRLKQRELDKATEIFSELWLGVMQKKHMVNPELILKNLLELESELGKDRFSDIYEVVAPDQPLPSEMAAKNRPLPQTSP